MNKDIFMLMLPSFLFSLQHNPKLRFRYKVHARIQKYFQGAVRLRIFRFARFIRIFSVKLLCKFKKIDLTPPPPPSDCFAAIWIVRNTCIYMLHVNDYMLHDFMIKHMIWSFLLYGKIQ